MKRESYFSKPGFYRIEVDGQLRPGWSDRIGAMQISPPSLKTDPAVTVLEGRVSDQAELAGILNTLYELHLSLLSVQYMDRVK
jgi:hypothetical protein